MLKSTRRVTMNDLLKASFFQMPRFFYEGENEFRKLSLIAKNIYMLLRDRHDLSVKNNWQNEKGEVYIYYTREKMCEAIGYTTKPITNAVRELVEIGLIEEERQGLGKPNKIFLSMPANLDFPKNGQNSISGKNNLTYHEMRNFRPNQTEINKTNFNQTDEVSYPILSVLDQPEISENYENFGNHETFENHWGNKTDMMGYDGMTTQENNPIYEKHDHIVYENRDHVNHGHPVGHGQGGQGSQDGQARQQKEKIKKATPSLARQASPSVPSAPKESEKSMPTPTTALRPTSKPTAPAPKYDYDEISEIIKENIDYDYIVSDKIVPKNLVDEIVGVITKTICSEYRDGYISMGEQKMPAAVVKSAFFKLGMMDIEYFSECYDRLTEPVIKMESYIRTSLFRNYGTIEHHYRNQVNVDMPQFARK